MNDLLRTLRWSAWLGWQIESNWTDPWLFAVYLLIKPVAGSLLLACMYWAAWTATSGTINASFLPYLYVSNACYMLVGAVTFGMTWTVIGHPHEGDLRKQYRRFGSAPGGESGPGALPAASVLSRSGRMEAGPLSALCRNYPVVLLHGPRHR